MYQADADEFEKVLKDLCLSLNRPYSDDMKRVFWEDLRFVTLAQVKRQALEIRRKGNRKFISADLKPPPEPEKARSTYEPFTGELAHPIIRMSAIAQMRFLMRQEVKAHMVAPICERLSAKRVEIVQQAMADEDLKAMDYPSLQAQLLPILERAFERAFIDAYPTESLSSDAPRKEFTTSGMG